MSKEEQLELLQQQLDDMEKELSVADLCMTTSEFEVESKEAEEGERGSARRSRGITWNSGDGNVLSASSGASESDLMEAAVSEEVTSSASGDGDAALAAKCDLLQKELAYVKKELHVMLDVHLEALDSKMETEHTAVLTKMREVLTQVGEERNFYRQKILYLRDALVKQETRNEEVERKVRRLLTLVKSEKVQIYKKVKEHFAAFREEIKAARKKDREIKELRLRIAELEDHAREEALRFSTQEHEKEELIAIIAQYQRGGTQPPPADPSLQRTPRKDESSRPVFLGLTRRGGPLSPGREPPEASEAPEDGDKSGSLSPPSSPASHRRKSAEPKLVEMSSSPSSTASSDSDSLSPRLEQGAASSTSPSSSSISISPSSPTSLRPASKRPNPKDSKFTSLDEVIGVLVAEKAPRPDYLYSILSTYRLFSNSSDFFACLRRKYEEASQSQGIIVQIRVANVVKHWVEQHSNDLFTDEEVHCDVLDFLKSELSENYAAVSKRIYELLDKKKADAELRERKMSLTHPITCSEVVSAADIFDFRPDEIGKQLSLIDSARMRCIENRELTSCAWGHSDKEVAMKLAGNIVLHTNQFNRISNWVTYSIVSLQNESQRVARIQWFLQLLKFLQMYRNFHTMYSVMAGLTSTPVYRLKRSWTLVGNENREILQDVKELTSPTSNFKALRAATDVAKPPFLPYIGTFLTDITFITNGGSSTNEEGQINISKFLRLGKVLKRVEYCRKYAFNYEPNKAVCFYLTSFEPLSEDELFQASRDCEPSAQLSLIEKEV